MKNVHYRQYDRGEGERQASIKSVNSTGTRVKNEVKKKEKLNK